MKKYNCFEDALMAFRNGHITQEELGAAFKASQNEKKTTNCIKAGANLPSQWGKVVSNEQRLIDNGHYMKTSERAKLDYMRDSYKKARKEKSLETKVIRVEKR